MKNANWIAVAFGMGFVLAPWANAQAPTTQPEVTTSAAAVIPADQQATKEQLTKLFEVMRIRDQLQSLMKSMPAMVQQQMQSQMKGITSQLPGGKPITPEQQAAIDKLMTKYMEKAFNIYPIDELLDDMAMIYQRHLSRTDVDAFIAFYQSPPGQHLLDAQPAIMKEYMPMVMEHMQGRTKALIDELTNDLTKELEDQTKSSAPVTGNPTQK
jgi:hypothetical protein